MNKNHSYQILVYENSKSEGSDAFKHILSGKDTVNIWRKWRIFAYFYMKIKKSVENEVFLHIFLWKREMLKKINYFWIFLKIKNDNYEENELFLHISIWKRQILKKILPDEYKNNEYFCMRIPILKEI